MRTFDVLRWALLGLCVVLALAHEPTQGPTSAPGSEQVQPETEQEALADIVFKLNVIQECIKDDENKQPEETGSRTKRSVYSSYSSYPYARDYLNLGLGFRRNDYQYFPNSLGYTNRYSAYYPEDLRVNIYRLPISRFFNSFYPGNIERPADGVVTRTFFRTGSYQNALADFNLFPLQQVRTLTTTTRTTVADPGFVGVFRDFPYEVRVCPNCCAGGAPCISFTGSTFPFRQVVRNFVYTRNTRTVNTINTGSNGFF